MSPTHKRSGARPPRDRATIYAASRLVVDPETVFSPGAVAVRDGAIVAAGPPGNVRKSVPARTARRDFPGAVLLPGLVNAHTHLQIPRLPHQEPRDDRDRPPPFIDWILRIIAWKRGAPTREFAENLRRAAGEALSFGTTCVGEIAGPDLSVYGDLPLRARVFAEGIGFDPQAAAGAAASVAAAVGELSSQARRNPLVAVGVSPHALYTVGEALLRLLGSLAGTLDVPACLHLAEFPSETEFLRDGGGEIATRFYPAIERDVSWFAGIGRAVSEYLRDAGLLRPGLLLVHNVHLPDGEVDALHAAGARFILCPRSNAAHGNGAPDVTRFVDAGIPFALGTDSLASVAALDPWEEMRAARALYRGTRDAAELARGLFRAASESGSAALSLPGGSLRPDSPADFAVVRDPGGPDEHLVAALIDRVGPGDVRATYVAGTRRFDREES